MTSETIVAQVLRYIRENPGCNGREIRQALDEKYTMRQLTNAMAMLRTRKNLIENRGGQAFTGRWYPVEVPNNKECPYFSEAERILKEMFEVPAGRRRTMYLAEQLQAVANQSKLF